MKTDTKNAPFFDLETLITPEGYIAAAETEDELGSVLRLHLCLEFFLDEFLKKIVPAQEKIYHPKRQPFSGKLSLAVAYGLAEPIAESVRIINRIRNSFAHRIRSSISHTDINKIADLVDQIQVLGHNSPPVRTKWIALNAVRPGEKLGFGTHGTRIDFVIVCSELLKKASGWLVIYYIRRNPSLVRNYSSYGPTARTIRFRYSLPLTVAPGSNKE